MVQCFMLTTLATREEMLASLSEKEEVIVDLRAHFAPGWEVLLDVLNGEIQGTCSSTIQKSQPGARTKPRACLT